MAYFWKSFSTPSKREVERSFSTSSLLGGKRPFAKPSRVSARSCAFSLLRSIQLFGAAGGGGAWLQAARRRSAAGTIRVWRGRTGLPYFFFLGGAAFLPGGWRMPKKATTKGA